MLLTLLSKMHMEYQRPQFTTLSRRLNEPRRFIQVVAGPRQVGKTTLVQQVCEAGNLPANSLV
jgi:predicted AAA+ superfamily ATPase